MTADRFNLLFPDDLLTLANNGDYNNDTKCALISTAYARLVTLGEKKKALELLPKLLLLFPEKHQQLIRELLTSNLSDQIKNSLVALYTPLISAQIAMGNTSGAGI